MVECRGGGCDNLRLLQGQHGESTQAGNAWTEWFSEENGGRQECSGGKVVTRLQCSGDNCDNKKLRCDSLRSGWTLSGKEWTNTWFSEEHGGQGGCYKPNQVVTGWKCNGGKCDNQQLQCAALTFSEKTPAAAGFDWTHWFGHGWSSGVPYGNFPIRGVQCHKGRCGKIRFYQGKWGADIEVSQLAHSTGWF